MPPLRGVMKIIIAPKVLIATKRKEECLAPHKTYVKRAQLHLYHLIQTQILKKNYAITIVKQP